MNHVTILLGIALATSLASCSTLIGRSQFHVPVDSEPEGAVVTYQGARVGVTPCTVVMTTRSSRLTLQAKGYHDQVAEAGSSVNPMLFGNLLFGGIVGLAVDGVSGASGQISETPMFVALTPAAEPAPDVWTRPAPQYVDEGDGWVREGEAVAGETPEPAVATRARPKPAAKPAPIRAEDEGWIPERRSANGR